MLTVFIQSIYMVFQPFSVSGKLDLFKYIITYVFFSLSWSNCVVLHAAKGLHGLTSTASISFLYPSPTPITQDRVTTRLTDSKF
jgi:hypothetical protein